MERRRGWRAESPNTLTSNIQNIIVSATSSPNIRTWPGRPTGRMLLALAMRGRPVLYRVGSAGPRKVPRETVWEAGRDPRSPAEKPHRPQV